MRGGLVIVFLFAVLAACQAPVSIGAVCTRTSDCEPGLACAGSRCRAECGDSRDCQNQASCVTFHGTGVCVPPSTPVPCVFNTDCGALFCRSGQCVRQCTADHDCESGACVNMLCSQPVMTPPMPTDAGTSQSDANACGPSLTFCGTLDACTDLATDPANCGGCGHVCATNERCGGSQCLCDAPLTTCGPACVDLVTDPGNCGTCGVTCSGGLCSAGHCCASGQIFCGGVCVDASVDGNCGVCGLTCDSGWSCRQRECRPPEDTCAAPRVVDVGDGHAALPLGDVTRYVDDVACLAGPSGDLFVQLSASSPTLTLVDPGDSSWSDMGSTCDMTTVACSVGACRIGEVLEVIDTTPRFFEVEAIGTTTPPRIYGVPVGTLPLAHESALPITRTVDAPWGSATTACGTGQASVVYTLDCASVNGSTDVTVRACDPTGAPVTLAVRRRADAALCGNVDPSCAGGVTVTIPGLSGAPLADRFLVMFVGHVSASDTGPINLTAVAAP